MNIENLSKLSSFIFPKSFHFDQSIVKYLHLSFDKYYSELSSIDSITDHSGKVYFDELEMKSIIDSIIILSNKINNVIEENYLGYNVKASSELFNTLDNYKNVIKNLCYFFNISFHDKPFYRIRQCDNKSHLTKEDLFHIPLTKRNLITSQRFSIPGYPSLYLGSSIYICWEELNRPSFDSLFVSKFIFSNFNDNKIINISYLPNHIINHVLSSLHSNHIDKTKVKDYFKSYLILWPLISSCLITAESKSSNFNVEYFIPQLFLEWIRKQDEFDGIMYFSIKYLRGQYLCLLDKNLVLPAKEIDETSGFCNILRNNILMTEPIAWSVASALYNDYDFSPDDGEKFYFSLNDKAISYGFTEFGRVEIYLKEMKDCSKL